MPVIRQHFSIVSRVRFPSVLAGALVLAMLAAVCPQPLAAWQEDPPATDTPPAATDQPADEQTETPTEDAPQTLTAAGDWEVLEPEGAGFRVEFPAKPDHLPRVVRPMKEVEVSVDLYRLEMNNGQLALVVAWHDVQEDPQTDAKRQEILDGGVKGAMVNVLGQMTSHQRIEVEGHPARHFTYAGARDRRQIAGQTRLVLVGRRVYQMTIVHLASQEPDADAVKRFFDSFKLVNRTP